MNISARQFRQPDLVRDVARILCETDLDSGALVLEITESVVMDDTELTAEKLKALKALGVGLAIDDFGTGYSSLSYLKRFPVDYLNIDHSFIDGLGQILEDTVLVSGMLALARSLDLKTVAEGIETADQLDRLKDFGCDPVQGYLLSKPLPADEVELLFPGPSRSAPRCSPPG